MLEPPPAVQDLVLVGGGHSHALVLRMLAMLPVPGLRLTLVSPAPLTPYSGMLPGLLAGHYRYEETHIDLARLCQWAGVRFICDEVVALDPARRRLRCRSQGELDYDLLSLDVGSQPELDSVPGARQYSIPVKPVAGLWSRWQTMLAADANPGHIAVVGGGAGSVEVALAMAYRFQGRGRVSLYGAAPALLPGYPESLRRAVLRRCRAWSVDVAMEHRVVEVAPGALHFAGGKRSDFDTLVWCTGAAGAPWVAESGLSTDDRGFLLVRDTLQSVDDERIFAAGDIASLVSQPRPKAGVFAVRQGPVLADNLRASARGESLQPYRPQRRFLSMLALGSRFAVAERNGLSVRGAWVWRWKNAIDQRFMRRFLVLPARSMSAAKSDDAAPAVEQAPCGGCGAKVGSDELSDALARLRRDFPEYAPVRALDDAAVLDVEAPLLQSTDQLRAMVDDPFVMGAIAAQHALSDLYASGARPHSALAQVCLPFSSTRILGRDLYRLLRGALSVFAPAGCRLVGGHSMQGPELQVGFTVNGVLDGRAPLSSSGARAGDVLVLAKPLGTGVLFAAHMQLRADGRDVHAAIDSMRRSNAEAAELARSFGVHALTDVTGFGLAGHLGNMLDSGLSATLEVAALPLLNGVQQALERGIRSTLHETNRNAARALLDEGLLDTPSLAPLFDPQTSGGLLMSVPTAHRSGVLDALAAAGYQAAVIGEVGLRGSAKDPTIRLS